MERDLSLQEQHAIKQLLEAFFPKRLMWDLVHISEGIVIRVRSEDRSYMLKILLETDMDRLLARLDWIKFLHENGLAVPKLVISQNSQLVESVEENGKTYTAYAYEEITLNAESKIDWSKMTTVHQLGEVMGKMHRLAHSYLRKHTADAFGNIQDAPWLDPVKQLHASQEAVFAPIERLRRSLSGLPKDQQNFGLVHDDLHTGNVFDQGDQLVILDFDCTVQHWYAADISSALLFRVWIAPAKEYLQMEAEGFLKALLYGYQNSSTLPDGWAEMMPVFLKLRELSLYWSFWKDQDLADSTPDSLFRYVYDSIRLEKPFLRIDYKKVLG